MYCINDNIRRENISCECPCHLHCSCINEDFPNKSEIISNINVQNPNSEYYSYNYDYKTPLYSQNEIPLPFFFVSESLERDQFKYYKLLNDIREKGNWNEWIKFFLETVTRQCRKYTDVVNKINKLYDETISKTCDLIKSSNSVKLIDALFRYPISDSKTIQAETEIPLATLNRYLKVLLEQGIIFSDSKSRNRKFFFYDLLALIKD